jgi:hypothetical protein
MHIKSNVKSLPRQVMAVPASQDANFLQVLWGRLRLWLGRVAEWMGLPGVIQNSNIRDRLTGQNIRVRVGQLFTVLSVNGRDYFFSRFTGRFNGTGSGRG